MKLLTVESLAKYAGVYVWYKDKLCPVIALRLDMQRAIIKNGTYCTPVDVEQLRPNLKRVAEITDEQLREICRMVVCPEIKYPEHHFFIDRERVVSGKSTSFGVRIDNDWFDEVVNVGLNGTVWMPDKWNARVGPNVYDMMRAWGYDLDGLMCEEQNSKVKSNDKPTFL